MSHGFASLAGTLFGTRNVFTAFGWEDWKQGTDGKWRSPGGATLTDPVYQRRKAAADGKKPAPKAGGGPAVPPSAPPAKPAAPPPESLAAAISAKLRAGQPLTAAELWKLADAAYGKSRAQGGYGPSDAYDAMEAGVNLALKGQTDPTADAASAAEQARNILNDVLRQLPTQTNRSGNKDALQQFSTPPHYAFVAAWLANLKSSDVVLEPSGGTGSLAVHAANSGATVIGNELDPRRAALLRLVTGQAVYGENAEQIGAILNGKVSPTAVVMNPPFSASATAGKDQQTAAKHIDQALQLVAPGGRVVAIVGRGMSPTAPTFRQWFESLKARGYSLRANVGVDGKEYTKYGTGFGTRVLVIDKEAPGTTAAVAGDVSTVGELIPLLEGIRNDRPEPTAATPGDAGGRSAPTGVAGGGSPRGAAAGGVGGAGGGGRPKRGRAGGGPAAAASGGGVGAARVGPGAGGGDGVGGGAGRGGRGGARPTAAGAGVLGAGQGGAGGEPGGERGGRVPRLRPAEPLAFDDSPPPAVKAVAGDESESLYEGYKPAVRFKGAKPHPGKLDESAAMAAVAPPKVTYRPTISPDVIESGALSDAALENVALAGQSHQQMLPADKDGVVYRRGYFIGDGTGAGKGRQVAGIIADNWNQGRRKHVWVSEKSPLLEDAVRDWTGVGMAKGDVVPFDKVKDAERAPGEGIAFITYDTLKSRPKDPAAKTNLQRLADWLGPDFDGVIAFDEAHNMANATETDGGRGAKKPSAKALAGVELQKLLPNARVVYVSATGATEVSNLAYTDRLGIWGKDTPFPDKQNFIGEMEAGGVGAMEAVAQSLKAAGLYNARSLSLNDGTPGGQVTYDRVTHTLTPDQVAMYDAAAGAWQTVLQNINAALEQTGGKQDRFAKAAAKSQFWGAQQRFFNQVMTAMQTPSVVTAMEKDIAEGRAPVVQLVNTMEAATGRAIDKAGDEQDYENLDVSPREILMQYLSKSFPVHRYEEYQDEEGNKRTRVVKDSAGMPVEDPRAVAMRDKLLDDLGGIRIPESPLDQIVNHFGPDVVAEATGRGERLVYRTQPDGTVKRVREARSPSAANVAEASAFQGGKKKALVFSDAGGTGRSYHADKAAKNQAKRVHYMLQPGWRADRAVQGLGRTHRTNQAVAPHYRLVEIEDLKAQKRFVSTIARRLDQLGALTRGQRQTGSGGLFSAADNLESREAKQALDNLFNDIRRNRVEGLDYKETMAQLGFDTEDGQGRPKEVETPPMSQFLNRLLSLQVGKQAAVFDAFDTRLQKAVESAAAAGQLDTGVEHYRADRLVRQGDKVVYTDPKTGAVTRLVTVTATRKIARRPFAANLVGEKPIGFFRNTQTGRVRAAYKWGDATDARTGRVTQRVGMRGPSGVVDSRHPEPYELNPNYGTWEPLDQAEAKRLWEAELAELPATQDTEEHFLTGSLLPIWDRIPKVERPKVFRFRTEGAAATVGRHVAPSAVPLLLKNLGVSADAKAYKAADVHTDLSTGRKVVRLANGWRLKPVRVGGERRIEILGPGFADHTNLAADGVIRERVQYDTRLFVPTGPEGAKVLERLTNARPITEVSNVAIDEFKEPAQPFDAFAWSDWKQVQGGKWRSPGGRTLSDAVYQRLSSRGGQGGGQAKTQGGQGGGQAAKPPVAGGRAPTIPPVKPSPAAPSGKTGIAPGRPGYTGHLIGTLYRKVKGGQELTGKDAQAVTEAVAKLNMPAVVGILITLGGETPAGGGEQATRDTLVRHVMSGGKAPPLTPRQLEVYGPSPAAQMTATLKAATDAIGGGKPPSADPIRKTQGFTRLERLMDMSPQEQERELLRRSARATPDESTAVRVAAAVKPNPAVTQAVEAQKPALDARYGERASGIFRAVADVFGRVLAAVKDPRFLAPAVGSVTGAGLGAIVGTLVGGPFGVGVGTSVGAGLGLMLGDKLGRYMTTSRLKLALRKALSQTVPAAAGTFAGVATGAATVPVAAANAAFNLTPLGAGVSLATGGSTWDSVISLAGAPFRLAGLVYGKLKGAIEPSAAKERKRQQAAAFAEPPDPVAVAEQVMAQAGIDTTAVSKEKIALALALAAAVADEPAEGEGEVSAFADWERMSDGTYRSPGGRVLSGAVFERLSRRAGGNEFEQFAWEDWKQQANGSWVSPNGRVLSDPVYQAKKAARAAEPPGTRTGRVLDKVAGAARKATDNKVGRVLKKADSAIGRVFGGGVEKAANWKDDKAKKLKQAVLNGKFGGLLRWAAGTGVGKAFFRDLERRNERIKLTAKESQEFGLSAAKLAGAERVVTYVLDNFNRNRRRYGIIPAVLIESAVFAVKFALPKLLAIGGAAAGGVLGAAGGGLGAVAGVLGGGAVALPVVNWLAKSLLGKVMTSLVRAVGESSAEWIKRAVAGKSAARARKGAGIVKRLAPQPAAAFAEPPAGQPTVIDVVEDVAGRIAEETGLDLPPEAVADLLGEIMDKLPAAAQQDSTAPATAV